MILMFIVGILIGAWFVGGPWYFFYLSEKIVELEKNQISAENEPFLFFTARWFKRRLDSNTDWSMVIILMLTGPYGWFTLFWGYLIEPLLKKFLKRNVKIATPATK